MLLPRVEVTQSSPFAPSPTADPSLPTVGHKTYNILTIVISVVAAVVVLACFYLFYWRTAPKSHQKPQLCVSRAGVARIRVGGPERWRIIEQVRREQEARDRYESDWAVRRKEEGLRDGVALPKYSKSAGAEGECRTGGLEIVDIHSRAIISVPPPAYDQTIPRPLVEIQPHL